MSTTLKTFNTLFDENIKLAITNDEIIEFLQNCEGRLRFYSGVDLTGATVITIEVQDPSSASVSWAGTIDSNPFYIYYDLESGDLNLEGEYVVLLQATLDGQKLKSKLARFTVVREHEDKNLY